MEVRISPDSEWRDYRRFLERMNEYKDKFQVSIVCYCLMTNHYHLLLRQNTDVPITNFMLRLGTSYAKYFNIKYKEVGSLFQGRFKAKLIDSDEYLLHVSRYIHRNPALTPGVELGLYPWSSYKMFINKVKENVVDSVYILEYFAKANPKSDYKNFVEFDFEQGELLEEFYF